MNTNAFNKYISVKPVIKLYGEFLKLEKKEEKAFTIWNQYFCFGLTKPC